MAALARRKPEPPPENGPAGDGPAAAPNNFDALAFSSLPAAEALKRINTEYFVRRSSGTIYHHGKDGELTALKSHQNFEIALGGRIAEINTPKGLFSKFAARVWLVSLAKGARLPECSIAQTALALSQTT